MQDQKRYQDAVQCLAAYEYEVLPDGLGYIVRHRSDHNDVSRARQLDELVDLAELIEWAARRHKRDMPA